MCSGTMRGFCRWLLPLWGNFSDNEKRREKIDDGLGRYVRAIEGRGKEGRGTRKVVVW